MSNNSEVPRRGVGIETIAWEEYKIEDFKKEFEFLSPSEALFYHKLVEIIDELADHKEALDDVIKSFAAMDAEGHAGSELALQVAIDAGSISKDARQKLKQALFLIGNSQ